MADQIHQLGNSVNKTQHTPIASYFTRYTPSDWRGQYYHWRKVQQHDSSFLHYAFWLGYGPIRTCTMAMDNMVSRIPLYNYAAAGYGIYWLLRWWAPQRWQRGEWVKSYTSNLESIAHASFSVFGTTLQWEYDTIYISCQNPHSLLASASRYSMNSIERK